MASVNPPTGYTFNLETTSTSITRLKHVKGTAELAGVKLETTSTSITRLKQSNRSHEDFPSLCGLKRQVPRLRD